MLHPIFSVLVSKPDLVIDHVAGYASLVREEASSVGGEVVKRAVAWAVVGVCAIIFLLLAGIAAMLAAIHGFHWMLLLVPAVPLALGVVAFMRARQSMPSKAFTELRSQLDADAQALRAMGAGS